MASRTRSGSHSGWSVDSSFQIVATSRVRTTFDSLRDDRVLLGSTSHLPLRTRLPPRRPIPACHHRRRSPTGGLLSAPHPTTRPCNALTYLDLDSHTRRSRSGPLPGSEADYLVATPGTIARLRRLASRLLRTCQHRHDLAERGTRPARSPCGQPTARQSRIARYRSELKAVGYEASYVLPCQTTYPRCLMRHAGAGAASVTMIAAALSIMDERGSSRSGSAGWGHPTRGGRGRLVTVASRGPPTRRHRPVTRPPD